MNHIIKSLRFRKTKIGRIIFKGTAIFCLFIVISMFSIFALYEFAGISSSNAVLYFIKDESGKLMISNDLGFDQADRLLFMVDASCLFGFLEGVASSSYRAPVWDLNWSSEQGKGVLKEVRPDGSKFLVVFSRYKEEEGLPHGLFIGGDLPYGDADRWYDRSRNNTGISYFDGKKWLHIWCSINEALSIRGLAKPVFPWDWTYLGSNILKSTQEEIIIRSRHELKTKSSDSKTLDLLMTRTLYKKKGEDYLVMKIEYSNIGEAGIQFSYSFGDEPWVGEFGDSRGDVGWTSDRIFRRESYLLPVVDTFAGYWDRGNEAAGEDHSFSGYANFVEWMLNPPSVVAFSNSFELDKFREGKPLDSKDNRIIDLLWLAEYLSPRQSRSYTLALGMAKPDRLTGLPLKPEVNLFESMQ